MFGKSITLAAAGLLGLCVLTVGIVRPSLAQQKVTILTGEWPPYVSETIMGYGEAAKIVTETFKRAGMEVEYEFMPWKRVFQLTEEGAYPMSFPWVRTEARESKVDFSDRPVMAAEFVAFYNPVQFPTGLKYKNYQELFDLKLRLVGVRSYFYEEYFLAAGLESHMVSSSDLAWKMLDLKRADVFVDDRLVGQMESEMTLGAEKAKSYQTGPVLWTQDLFPIFTKKNAQAAELHRIFNHQS